MDPEPHPPANQASKYRWPWFVLGAVLLGILLAVLWLSREVQRTRQLRQTSESQLFLAARALDGQYSDSVRALLR